MFCSCFLISFKQLFFSVLLNKGGISLVISGVFPHCAMCIPEVYLYQRLLLKDILIIFTHTTL